MALRSDTERAPFRRVRLPTSHRGPARALTESAGVEVPPEHVGCGIVDPSIALDVTTFDWTQFTAGLFAVHSAKQYWRPRNAYVAVKYRGYWFYVDDCGHDTKVTVFDGDDHRPCEFARCEERRPSPHPAGWPLTDDECPGGVITPRPSVLLSPQFRKLVPFWERHQTTDLWAWTALCPHIIAARLVGLGALGKSVLRHSSRRNSWIAASFRPSNISGNASQRFAARTILRHGHTTRLEATSDSRHT
jgi:hypothetical protein